MSLLEIIPVVLTPQPRWHKKGKEIPCHTRGQSLFANAQEKCNVCRLKLPQTNKQPRGCLFVWDRDLIGVVNGGRLPLAENLTGR